MNKQDLKQSWGKYCDTDKLVTEMIELLKKYGHRCSEHGVCTLLNEYFRNKEPLIRIIASSKNYIGDMRISLEKEFERKISQYEINSFINNFAYRMHMETIYKDKDESGKTLNDYLSTGKPLFDLNTLPNRTDMDAKLHNMKQFDYCRRYTNDSVRTYNNAVNTINYFKNFASSTIPRDCSVNGIEFKAKTKTSRAFNRACCHYGIDKLNPITTQVEENGVMVDKVTYPYNKLFATYSDLVSGLVRKMNFVISVNPLDYLTMSNGINWRSCHMIDGGMYQGGCLSYLLDASSMVTFVIEKNEEIIHLAPRLYRQMFHYERGMFMQNRLYPQDNDGATDLYVQFRDYIAEEFSDLLNVERKWKVECGYNACKNHVNSTGAHYKDYHHNNKCAIFYPEEKHSSIRDYMMGVGHNGICPHCGGSYTANGRLSHSDCRIQTRRNNEEEDFDWTL